MAGRPKGSGPRLVVKTFSLMPALLETLRQLSRLTGRSGSLCVREALVDYFLKHGVWHLENGFPVPGMCDPALTPSATPIVGLPVIPPTPKRPPKFQAAPDDWTLAIGRPVAPLVTAPVEPPAPSVTAAPESEPVPRPELPEGLRSTFPSLFGLPPIV